MTHPISTEEPLLAEEPAAEEEIEPKSTCTACGKEEGATLDRKIRTCSECGRALCSSPCFSNADNHGMAA